MMLLSRALCVSLMIGAAAEGQPPIASPFTVTSTTQPILHPDVAYDETNDVYLVVWEQLGQILAQRVTAAGVVAAGAPLVVGFGSYPRVCNINIYDTWVVVWKQGTTLTARAVYAAAGSMSNTISLFTQLPSGSGEGEYAVAGETRPGLFWDDAVVVWAEATRIRGRRVDVSAGPGGTIIATFPSTVRDPLVGNTATGVTISNAGGPFRRLLVAWSESASGLRWVEGAVVDMNLNMLDPDVNLVPPSSSFPVSRSAAGDGNHWVMVYERSTGRGDIFCRTVDFDSGNPTATSVGSECVVANDPSVREEDARVGWFGGSIVTISRLVSGNPLPIYRSFDPFTCARCESVGWSPALIAVGSGDTAVASERSGGGLGGGGLMVWQEFDSGRRYVQAAALTPFDGQVTDLGGGCGVFAEALSTCARQGHVDYRLRLRGAEVGRDAWLFVSPLRIDAACGPCTLVPNPLSAAIVGPVRTSSRGHAEVAVSLGGFPLKGYEFFAQWYLDAAAPTCTQLGADFSNALQVVIQ